MQKNYHIDTSVLMESENAVEIMRNGEENKINISITVLNELDGLSKTNNKSYRARKVIENLWKNKEFINFTGNKNQITENDDLIIRDSIDNNDPILVTNDKLMRLKSYACGIKSENYRYSKPFNKESEIYTGFIDYNGDDKFIENCFFYKEGKLFQYNEGIERCIGYENQAWKVTPKDLYQNSALDLMLNPEIDLVTIQSKSGTGKTLLSLASAMKMVLEKRLYKKIIIIKYPVNIGTDLGYLPGTIDEKMQPYWKPIYDLLLELNEKREARRLFIDNNVLPTINPRKCEFLPVNFIRGQNINDSLVIIDEAQNIPRDDMRTILSRMGENVKVICEGDVSQVDNNKCTRENNGLNWVIKKMTGYSNYGHLTMNCKRTRGAICDMVIESGL